MRSIIRVGLTITIVAGASSAVLAKPLSPELVAELTAAIKDDPEARQQLQSLVGSKPQTKSAQTTKAKAKDTAEAPASPPAKQPDAVTKLIQSNLNKAPSDRQYSPCAGWQFILRQSWKDLGNAAGAACPDGADKAQGATISFADDLVAKNKIVTINGTAAVIYNTITGDVPPPTPYAVSLGAYTTVNDVSNTASSAAKSNVDTLAYGGLINLGYHNFAGATNYFMLRAGMTEDHIKNTTAGSVVLDWSPVIGPYIHVPYHLWSFGIPIITRLDTDLVARYDSATGAGQLLAFNGKRNSLRLGPELALNVLPDPGRVSGPITRLSALFGYDIWYETFTGRRLNWFTSSVNYNIDEAGNFGIKGTYNNGQDELTGKTTSIYTVGLSGKI